MNTNEQPLPAKIFASNQGSPLCAGFFIGVEWDGELSMLQNLIGFFDFIGAGLLGGDVEIENS
jgi:hypothetical protein